MSAKFEENLSIGLVLIYLFQMSLRRLHLELTFGMSWAKSKALLSSFIEHTTCLKR